MCLTANNFLVTGPDAKVMLYEAKRISDCTIYQGHVLSGLVKRRQQKTQHSACPINTTKERSMKPDNAHVYAIHSPAVRTQATVTGAAETDESAGNALDPKARRTKTDHKITVLALSKSDIETINGLEGA